MPLWPARTLENKERHPPMGREWGTRGIRQKPGKLLALRTERTPNVRMRRTCHPKRHPPASCTMESGWCDYKKTETIGGTRTAWGRPSQTTKNRGRLHLGSRRDSTDMGRRQRKLGFLIGQSMPQPQAYTIICGTSQKRKNEEPSAETSSKKQRQLPAATRPVIHMIMVLHHSGKKHRVKALLDTGCLIVLISNRKMRKLAILQKEHKQTRRIENYTGEKVPGACQFYI